uniref:C2 domain-containing protein n=1 Tax=Syphacia muris TaxID=451379 RepID=A0A0N5AZ54_9BILA
MKALSDDVSVNVVGCVCVKMSLDTDRRYQLSSNCKNKSLPNSPLLYESAMLAPRVRSYVSHPVTWQPSADQRRLIGHMILHKTDGLYSDLGFKVVGGRRSDTGRLGAFITRVKPGSVADTVGRLKAGDEVLEWNGHQLQNTTFDQVYEIINSSRNDTQVELIVCRNLSLSASSDNYLSVQRLLPQPYNFSRDSDINEISFDAPLEPALTHSQSVTLSPHMQQFLQNSAVATGRPDRSTIMSPFNTGYRKLPFTERTCNEAMAKGQIFGRIEISLCYSSSQRQLVVTIHRAVDLAPRSDGVMRNPYVKIFLLPDRSEKSRRQSAVLAETCMPIWDEPFYYHGLTEAMLIQRVLEVTVWDYDKFETNSFLGETLIDLSEAQLDDEPIFYTLVDMDEENPLRARLRQRRLNVYQLPSRPRSEMSHYSARQHYDYGDDYNPYMMYYGISESRMSDYRQPVMEYSSGGMHKSRTYDRGRVHTEEDWTINNNSNNRYSGYLSDQAYSSPLSFRYNGRERRPRSATALRQRPMEKLPHQSRNLPNNSWRIEEQIPVQQTSAQAIDDERAQQVQYDESRLHNKKIKGEIMHENMANMAEYGSDGSETLSVHSSRMFELRKIFRTIPGGLPNGNVVHQNSNENRLTNPEYFGDEDVVSDSTITKTAVNIKEKERKKGLINRLHIPGRSQQIKGKRAGFSRTEEVGVPEWLAATPFTKQISKESTDSGHTDNWGPVLTEGPLGAFIEDLGPGQVVGRQVLASPVLGEINIGIAVRNALEIQVIRARNLVAKPGKSLPAPYVKIYLLKGKQCVAKAKTNTAARSKNPEFQQQFIFNYSPRKKMLQITLMGEYSRMERRSFMGIAQIRLDDLELSDQPLYGWYKLFHSSSLAGAAPTRKDSEASLNDLKQQQQQQ